MSKPPRATLASSSGMLKAMASTSLPRSETVNFRCLASAPFSSGLRQLSPRQPNSGGSFFMPQGSKRESSSTISMVISAGEISMSIS